MKTPIMIGDILKLSSHVLKVVDIKMVEGMLPAPQPTAAFVSGMNSRLSSRVGSRA